MSNLWQDLDKIKIFTVVADTGKINKASELLHLTQPSISRAIQKLEESFGSPLFVRSRDGVKLTTAGQLLYKTASEFLRHLEDVQIKAKNQNEPLSGHLNIGTYESLAEYLWPDFLLQIQKNYPALHLSIKTNQEQGHLANLLDGTIDMLVDAEPQIHHLMTSWPLYKDRFAFFCANQLNLKKLNPIQASTFSLIYVKKARDENGLTIEDHLIKHEFYFARYYCFDSFSTVKQMAIKGLGIAVLPKRLSLDDENRKRIKKIHLAGFPSDSFGDHTIYATVKSQHEKDMRLRKVISLLKKHLN